MNHNYSMSSSQWNPGKLVGGGGVVERWDEQSNFY